MAQDADEQELFYISLNDDKQTTIVLLHGLLGSHLEFSLVIPQLSGYHLLIPDLSGHSRSAALLPATIPANAERVAALIRRHAHGGKAHVVGMSTGGKATLYLTKQHPELVETAFATGAAPFTGVLKWLAENPYLLYFSAKLFHAWLPGWVYKWIAGRQGIRIDDEFLMEVRQNVSWHVVRDMFRSSASAVAFDDIKELNVKVLLLAGMDGDDVEGTKKMAGLLTMESSRAALVKGAVHAWDMQLPDLFAQGVLAWIKGRPLPERFELVS